MADINENYNDDTMLCEYYRIQKSNIDVLNKEITTHINNKNNPHSVTKKQVGLSNVDNTSDKNKPVSDLQKAELDKKTDKAFSNVTLTNLTVSDDEVIESNAKDDTFKIYKGSGEDGYTVEKYGDDGIKLNLPTATDTYKGLMSPSDKNKLDGIAKGAEANQNAFSKITLFFDESGTIESFPAKGKESALHIYAGNGTGGDGYVIRKQANTDALKLDILDATKTCHGLMSADDKKKLDNMSSGGGNGGGNSKKNSFDYIIGSSVAGYTSSDCDLLCSGTQDNIKISEFIRNKGSNKTYYFLPGTYTWDSKGSAITTGGYTGQIYLKNLKGIKLQGASCGNVTFKLSSGLTDFSGGMIFLDGASDIEINNICFDNGSYNGYQANIFEDCNAIRFIGSQNINILNCRFKGTAKCCYIKSFVNGDSVDSAYVCIDKCDFQNTSAFDSSKNLYDLNLTKCYFTKITNCNFVSDSSFYTTASSIIWFGNCSWHPTAVTNYTINIACNNTGGTFYFTNCYAFLSGTANTAQKWLYEGSTWSVMMVGCTVQNMGSLQLTGYNNIIVGNTFSVAPTSSDSKTIIQNNITL